MTIREQVPVLAGVLPVISRPMCPCLLGVPVPGSMRLKMISTTDEHL